MATVGSCYPPCLNWPPPDLDCGPCLTGAQPAQLVAQLVKANQIVFDRVNRRFPGCDCIARLRPCVYCRCGCGCQPCKVDRIDLFGTLHHPVHEILSIEIEGVDQPLDGWRIDSQRYLVRAPGCPWPQQNLQADCDSECTWSVTVRYGTPPPFEVLCARDELFYDFMAKCAPEAISGCNPGRLVKVSEKGTEYKSTEPDWMKCITERYGRRWLRAMYIDPAGYCDPNGDDQKIVVCETSGPESSECDLTGWANEWAQDLVDDEPSGVKKLDIHGLPVG